ncbi:MAG: AEC family transporter [Proteobacteria bacterium]|nr:AEC family transporter [Pseudomonadota bacterium]
MDTTLHIFALTSPLFLLVLLGFVLTRWLHWPHAAAEALTHFVFSIALPALLFQTMREFARLPHVDARLLVVYFGGCLVVYALGRVIGHYVLRVDAERQAVLGVAGIFSNIVLLGVPMAQMTLPPAALPAVSLVLIFNSLLLWTLVSVSIEWARHRDVSLQGFGKTARGVLLNPIVAGILLGTAFGYTGWTLPDVVGRTLGLVTQSALPMSLIALGMSLAAYGIRAGARASVAVVALKLVAMPLVVYAFARLAHLPANETIAVVLLAALPTGANAYLMARAFNVVEGPVASALVLSTALAAFTTPTALVLVRTLQ